MVFSSIEFLFYFLPAVIICYFASPKSMKNLILLAFSLLFYAWGEPKLIALMLLSVFSAYVFGIFMDRAEGKRRLFLMCLSVAVSLSFLFYFKYLNFFIRNINLLFSLNIKNVKITMPIGISFYTFQIISYTADLYLKKVPVQKSFLNLAAYISLFPQLIAGPIVRYKDVSADLESRSVTFEGFSDGAYMFTLGLAKKVILANSLGEMLKALYAANGASRLYFWLIAVIFMLQIYLDFSGYSQMASGIGKIFGFTFPRNFNFPLASKSISEFWRRWHISLGTFFRDYVYIPLGGNRKHFIRNVIIVWFLTGFWHGANYNFIIWGLYFAFFLILEKFVLLKAFSKLKEPFKTVVSHAYVLFFVSISFVIFNTEELPLLWARLVGLFFAAKGTDIISLFYLRNYLAIIILSVLASFPLPLKLKEGRTAEVIRLVITAVLLFISTAYIVDGSFNPFLYFRF